jgi:hypothetical protein
MGLNGTSEIQRIGLRNGLQLALASPNGGSIARIDVPLQHTARVSAAVGEYNQRFRLNEAERSTLADEMRGVLTDEQRDDFRAALARRPVVKASGLLTVQAALDALHKAQER